MPKSCYVHSLFDNIACACVRACACLCVLVCACVCVRACVFRHVLLNAGFRLSDDGQYVIYVTSDAKNRYDDDVDDDDDDDIGNRASEQTHFSSCANAVDADEWC